jgi:AAA ATPase domain
MQISKFKLANYKIFRELEEISFPTGMIVIVGENNSGKTAFLDALSLSASSDPHLSESTKPVMDSAINPHSTVRVEFSIQADYIKNFLLRKSYEDSGFLHVLPTAAPITDHNQLIQDISYGTNIILIAEYSLGDAISQREVAFSFVESSIIFPNSDGSCPSANIFSFHMSSDFSLGEKLPTSSRHYIRLENHLFQDFISKIYKFRAERFNTSTCEFGDSSVLRPDASNLPIVLNKLGENPALLDEFNTLVSLVLPQIKRVTVRPIGASLEVMVWNIEPKTKRADLAVPLAKCGTGVGQVLAILYVALTSSSDPRVIIIDEPQSFLHPGAAKRLIQALKLFPQHQYFISTHSPDLITTADPSLILSLEYDENERQSVPRIIDKNDKEELKSLLNQLGVKLSDVFGADAILWVEGPSEEACFPLILKELCGMTQVRLASVQVLSLTSTGDLEGKRAGTFVKIYEKISGKSSLLPNAIAFIRDMEGVPKEKLKELEEAGITFLPRAMYENYLISAGALTAFANAKQFRKLALTVEEVSKWLEKAETEKVETKNKFQVRNYGESWSVSVDGTKLLDAFFTEFSDNRFEYSQHKVEYSLELTSWLIKKEPESLTEVKDLLQRLVQYKPLLKTTE